jgi:hypothetical protein
MGIQGMVQSPVVKLNIKCIEFCVYLPTLKDADLLFSIPSSLIHLLYDVMVEPPHDVGVYDGLGM